MSEHKNAETYRCPSCGEPLITAQSKSGSTVPITHSAYSNGEYLLFRGDQALTGRVGIQARHMSPVVIEFLRGEGVPLRHNHHSNCPAGAGRNAERDTETVVSK